MTFTGLVEALRGLLEDAGVPDFRIELACRATDDLLRRAVVLGESSAYVTTGDIPAMWLRDSTAQVRPLLALAPRAPGALELVRGVLRTQVEHVLIDPRANAFNPGPTGAAMRRDFRDQSPWVSSESTPSTRSALRCPWRGSSRAPRRLWTTSTDVFSQPAGPSCRSGVRNRITNRGRMCCDDGSRGGEARSLIAAAARRLDEPG